MRHALIENGVVFTVVEDVSPEWLASQPREAVEVPDDSPVASGWGYDGEEFSEPAPVVMVPFQVTRRQARRALLAAGLLATVDGLIDAMEGPAGEAARIDWYDSQDIQRNWPLVNQLSPALGLSSEELDALFIAAAAL